MENYLMQNQAVLAELLGGILKELLKPEQIKLDLAVFKQE